MTFLQAGQNQETFDFYTYEPLETEHPIKPPIYIARSPVMKQVYQKIKHLSLSCDAVLILGDKGVGKSTSARQIFYENPANKTADFILIEGRQTDSSDLEKQLFDPKMGVLFSNEEGKNLFIKNVDGLSQSLQKKLYQKFFKEKQNSLPRLIVSADERIFDISDGKKAFYQPLFNVLANKVLILPPLAERRECIADLIAFFNKESGSQWKPNKEALCILAKHSWGENLNSLKAVCLKTALYTKTNARVTPGDLDLILKEIHSSSRKIKYQPDMTLEKLIDTTIQMSLDHFKSKQKSAKALGISVKTIYNKIRTGKVIF